MKSKKEKLETFVERLRARAETFNRNWLSEHEKDPKSYPLLMDDWEDQYQAWIELGEPS